MAETILYASPRVDILRARIRALRKAGYRVADASSEYEILRLSVDAKPSLMVMSRSAGLSLETWGRLKADPATERIPVIAICSPGAEKHWARGADLCLPESVTSAQLVSVIRLILRAREAERGLARLKTDVESGSGTGRRDRNIPRCNPRVEKPSAGRPPLTRRHGAQSDLVSVVHNLRSPLCTVTMVSSWILGEYSDRMDATGLEYLGLLKKSVERMTAVIDSASEIPSTSGSRG
jgi:hypothetical protein